MDIEKAFDSLDHDFLIIALQKFSFGKNFVNWIKILLRNQESCVINGGTTTNYFKLERGARQGDPILSKILFLTIKNNTKINGIEIFDHVFLYTSTFFLKDTVSIEELVRSFNIFSHFSGLCPNINKCELAGIGSLKGVKEAVCGLKLIDLTNETLKILGIHFSYNYNLQIYKKIFCL